MPILSVSGIAPLLSPGDPASWNPDHIDLSGLEWASPYDIVALASIYARLKADGDPPTVGLPADPLVLADLHRGGLADLLPGDWERREDPGDTDPTLIPLLQLASAEDWDFMLPDLWPQVASGIGDGALLRPTFEILSELIDNAATHGESPAGTFVCARYYDPGEVPPGLWLGIADAGRSIPGHLRLNPKYRDVPEDERLIQLARRPWVTGTRDRRGWGLVQVFEEASALGVSELLIRSGAGQGFFRLRASQRPFAAYRPLRPRVPGTWIHLRVSAA